MATTTASGRPPPWPLFFAQGSRSVDTGAGLLRRLEHCRSSVSCSNTNSDSSSNSGSRVEIGLGTGKGKGTATARGRTWDRASGGNTEYEVGDCEFKREHEDGCELKVVSGLIGTKDRNTGSETAGGGAGSRDSVHEKRQSQRRARRKIAASTTAAATAPAPAAIAPQRQHQHRQVQKNASILPPQPPPPPPPPPASRQHAHHPNMPPASTFASCGHSAPPFPALTPPSSTTTSLSGYCRPCDFTRTRRTVLRITEHYEEQIADLETRIEKAKLELWRTWNEYLAERKELAIRAVERLKGDQEKECEGAWREFDERWGGRVVAAGS